MAEEWTNEQDFHWHKDFDPHGKGESGVVGVGGDNGGGSGGGGLGGFGRLIVIGFVLVGLVGVFRQLGKRGDVEPVPPPDPDPAAVTEPIAVRDSELPSSSREVREEALPWDPATTSGTASSSRLPSSSRPDGVGSNVLTDAVRLRDQASARYEKAIAAVDLDLLGEHGGESWRAVLASVSAARAESADSLAAIRRSIANYENAIQNIPLASIEAFSTQAIALATVGEFDAAEASIAQARTLRRDHPLIATATTKVNHLRYGFSGKLDQFDRARSVNGLRCNRQGTRLYAIVDDKVVEYDLKSGDRLRELSGHTDEIKCLDLFHDDQKLVTGSVDQTAIVWDLETGQVLKRLPESNTVGAIAGSADGRTVATAALFKNPQVWNVQTGRPLPRTKIQSYPGNSTIKALAFDRSGKRLLGGGTSYNTHVWVVSNGRQQSVLAAHKNSYVLGLSFSPDGKHLLMLDASGVTALDGNRFREQYTLDISAKHAPHVTITGDSQRFFAMDAMYDLNDGQMLGRTDFPIRQPQSVTVTPDGKRFILATVRGIEVIVAK